MGVSELILRNRGQKNRPRKKKKNKFLGTEVPRNFSDQCSLDFAYFLCLFSGRRAKSSQELCSSGTFFSYFRWVFLLDSKKHMYVRSLNCASCEEILPPE